MEPDWAALPQIALHCVLRAGCDAEDVTPPGEADYANSGAAALPFGLLLCAVCQSWRAELRSSALLWRNLLCARAVRGLWACGQHPPAVSPAALLRHRCTLRLAHAAGAFLVYDVPHLGVNHGGNPLRYEVQRMLGGAYMPLAAEGRHVEADAVPTLLSVRLSERGDTTFTFAVLGTRDSAYGGAWLLVHVVTTPEYPLAPPSLHLEPQLLPVRACALLRECAIVRKEWWCYSSVFSTATFCAAAATAASDVVQENVAARQLAATALAGGNGRADDDNNGDDALGGHEVLRVALPPGRALLRMALHTGVALVLSDVCGYDDAPQSCRLTDWDAFLEEAWRREAARRARLARVLRWAAALAGAADGRTCVAETTHRV